jgi:YegS/Rv2252/BmrU family lipid kinase
VNGLVGSRGVELAILPRGTGTDFARSFRIPGKLEAAVRVALEGGVREIDAGRVAFRTWDGGSGEACFANIASVGMSGAIAKRVNESRRSFALRASYLAATLSVFVRWQPSEVRVSVDAVTRRARMQDVIVANCRYFAAGMMICPEAEPDDGLFDALLIGDITKGDLLTTLPKIYRGTHLPHPKAELLRGKLVEIDADEPLPVELDGEQPGTTPVRFELLPGAIRLRVPGGTA